MCVAVTNTHILARRVEICSADIFFPCIKPPGLKKYIYIYLSIYEHYFSRALHKPNTHHTEMSCYTKACRLQ